MPSEMEFVNFKDFVDSLSAASESDLVAANKVVVNDSSAGPKKLDGDAVAKGSVQKIAASRQQYEVFTYDSPTTFENVSSGSPQRNTLPYVVQAGTEIVIGWTSDDGIKVNIFLVFTDNTTQQVALENGVTSSVVLNKDLDYVRYTPYSYPTGVTTATFTGMFNTDALKGGVENLEIGENKINYAVFAHDFGTPFTDVATGSAKEVLVNGVIPTGTILIYGWRSATNAKCVVRLMYTDGSAYQLPNAENNVEYRLALSRDIVGLKFTPYSFPSGVTKIDFDAIFETEGSDDNVENLKDTARVSNFNDCKKPIICFVFDDGNIADSKVVSWMKPYGLVSTFAIIGNVDPDDNAWKATADRYLGYMRDGHDVICHGITGGISVDNIYGASAVGLGYMNDEDSYKVLRSEKLALKRKGFKADALCYFNSTRYSPHILDIVGGEFNFAVGSSAQNNDGVNTTDVSPIALSRNSLDSAGQAAVLKDLVNANIDKRVLIIIGTHASSFGGTGKETEANVQDFFAYVASLRDKGLVLNMGFHDAVATFFGNRNKIVLKKNSVIVPDYGQLVNNNGVLQLCTDEGSKLVAKVSVGGSVSAGSFKVNLKNNRNATSTYTEVALDGTETIEGIVDILCSKNSYQEVGLEKESSSEFVVRYSLPKNISVTFSENSTNLEFSVEVISAGRDPVFT